MKSSAVRCWWIVKVGPQNDEEEKGMFAVSKKMDYAQTIRMWR